METFRAVGIRTISAAMARTLGMTRFKTLWRAPLAVCAAAA